MHIGSRGHSTPCLLTHSALSATRGAACHVCYHCNHTDMGSSQDLAGTLHPKTLTSLNPETLTSLTAQHCHHEPPCVKAAVREDPRCRALSAALLAASAEWKPRALGNVAWAHAVLRHGPPNLLELVRPAPCRSRRTRCPISRVPGVGCTLHTLQSIEANWASPRTLQPLCPSSNARRLRRFVLYPGVCRETSDVAVELMWRLSPLDNTGS